MNINKKVHCMTVYKAHQHKKSVTDKYHEYY